jgi:hypothetical protein
MKDKTQMHFNVNHAQRCQGFQDFDVMHSDNRLKDVLFMVNMQLI